ncbi:MAG: Fic family protein, partial [Deltaproteobacteria bacterium]|nr:Fic family protein [Deltaproteobacteria bacterium]
MAERVRVPEGARRAWCRRELVDSVQLDGLRTTVGAVLDLAHRAGEPADEGHPAWEHAPRASRRVILGESALSRALPRVALAPIRSAMLRELHARAMAGSGGEAPGRWREVEVWIGPPGSTIRTARFVPPPPALVPELVARLDAFLAVDGPGPGLVRAALAYHQLETIQPFAEGSGLANRMLVTLLLTETAGEVGGRAGLSRSFLDRPAEYLRCLQAVRERGDWETWVEYFLRGVAEAAHRAAAYLEGLEDMRREHVHMVDRDLGASAASAAVLLESLLCRPVVQVADVARLAGRTFANANQLV